MEFRSKTCIGPRTFLSRQLGHQNSLNAMNFTNDIILHCDSAIDCILDVPIYDYKKESIRKYFNQIKMYHYCF